MIGLVIVLVAAVVVSSFLHHADSSPGGWERDVPDDWGGRPVQRDEDSLDKS